MDTDTTPGRGDGNVAAHGFIMDEMRSTSWSGSATLTPVTITATATSQSLSRTADAMKPPSRVLAGMVLALLPLAGGCSLPNQPPVFSSTTLPSVTARALLDREAASVVLPLDRYGMSDDEQARVRAARQILFAQCVTGVDQVPAAVIHVARRELDAAPAGRDWLFGFWDAAYIEAHGIAAPVPRPLGEGLSPTPEAVTRCAGSDALAEVRVVSGQVASDAPADAVLVALVMESTTRTVADPRFLALRDRRDQCLTHRGYAINQASFLRGVTIDADLTEEDALTAAIAEATCADEIDYMQQVSDLAAAHQERLITQHAADLVAVRGRAEAIVATANEVLARAGVP